MTKVEALQILMSGGKVSNDELTTKYIYMNDKGQVVDDKGGVFNIQLAPDNGWSEYTPKKKLEIFNKSKALENLMSGKKISAVSWDNNRYIYIDDRGQIVDNKGELFNFMATEEDKWSLYIENKKEVENKALMSEINKLHEMIETLMKQKPTTTANIVDKSCINKADREEMELFFYGATGSAIKELFKSELEDIKDKNSLIKVITKFIPYCWMGKKFATARAYYVDMRNIIKEVLSDSSYLDIALDLFMIPSEVHDEVKKADSKKVIEKINDRQTFNPEEIYELIDFLKTNIKKAIKLGRKATVEDFKKAGIPIAKQQTPAQARAYLFSIYLALVTGRRIGEILKTLEIVKEGGVWYFKGITKKGQDDVKIPAVICDDDINFVKSVLMWIRKDLDTSKLTLKQVNSKYNMVFNRSLKRITGTNYTFHDLREIYAELCYLKHGKVKGTEREELDYKAKILGHDIDPDRLLATEHYMTMKGE